MAIHICRDYVTQNGSTNRTYIPAYLMSIFLRRVLTYTYVSDTNFPINPVGNLLIATGDSTPTASSPTFGAGAGANIAPNGASIEVTIPTSVKGVQAADVGRIMCLKSTAYPTRNSGLFVITALDQGNVTSVAAGSNGQALPGTGNVINVLSTTGFPASGTLYIGAITTTTTVVAMTGTYTLTVGSTTGFPSSGTLLVLSSAGVQTVTYTSTTTTTFVGCTGGSGSTFNGGTVTTSNGIQTVTYTGGGGGGTQFTGTSGGTGTMVTGEPVYWKNNYVIDYRANGDPVMQELTTSLIWYLYDKDANCPFQGANNTGGANEYRGNGNSTTPRIILQSPHATGWKMRICIEAPQDVNNNQTCNAITFVPGFDGSSGSAGDFSIGGKHLHGPLFWDTSTYGYNTGCGVGDNNGANGATYRCTMMGDDGGQTVSFIGRRPGDANTPEAFYITFGLPDNEPLPLPLDNTERLYCLGNGVWDNGGNGRMSNQALSVGNFKTSSRIQGAAFHFVPMSCGPSLWTYLYGVNQQASPIYDGSAGDSPFTSATELTSVDLVVGVVATFSDSDNVQRFPYYPRVIGNLPLARAGRTNFPEYSLTTDSASWSVSTTSGNGVSPIQVTTTAVNTLVTGQTVAINGVGGNTAANGTFVVTVINNTNFTLNGTTGNGAYTSGGTVYRGASYQHFRNGTYLPWNGPAVVP